MTWHDEAACLTAPDPEIFFPAGTTGDAVGQIVSAKSVCSRCPVRGQCLEFALTSRQDFGVWGGLTEEERRSLRRSRQRAARREAGKAPVAA
jgi:WhiB family transcriptional regulator, redox-sensing transcriptional regulator